jgi:NADH-ubiquinone oxidoreductase chain 3
MNILCIIFCISILISFIILGLSLYISKKIKHDHEKMSSFECGFDSLSSRRIPFSIKFFLISILFLVFDVELAILIPLIKRLMITKLLSWLLTRLFLVTILLVGLYYEWSEGVLNWKK